jgi:hypothetical protein
MSDADPVGIWPSLDIACFGDAADDRNDQDLRLVQGIICAAWERNCFRFVDGFGDAWLNRNRRLAKDFEASIASAKAWVYIASVQLLIRRLA